MAIRRTEVRRIAETEDRSAFVFGVAFALLAPGLQQKIDRTIAQSSPRPADSL